MNLSGFNKNYIYILMLMNHKLFFIQKYFFMKDIESFYEKFKFN
jgi:hypothetical protein